MKRVHVIGDQIAGGGFVGRFAIAGTAAQAEAARQAVIAQSDAYTSAKANLMHALQARDGIPPGHQTMTGLQWLDDVWAREEAAFTKAYIAEHPALYGTTVDTYFDHATEIRSYPLTTMLEFIL